MESELKTSSYDYYLPSELIASYPANPKDSARLLVYDRKTDTISHAIFRDLFTYLPQNICVLLNDTKVIKARIFGKKQSGGKVEILLNSPLSQSSFKAYMRGRVKPEMVIDLADEVRLRVKRLFDDGTREVEFFDNNNILNIKQSYEYLEQNGHVPLPPYIKREDNKEDEKNYQTLFAKHQGAIAAPTASLHFTTTMFEELKKRYDHAFITLHVGSGTFKPVSVENIEKHNMHGEFFNITHEAKEILKSTRDVLCIGTTVTRVVEDFARNTQISGECKLFLHPKNKPIRTNHLLTNFHLPKSTLLMLVASFVGLNKALQLYKIAVDEKYRFFSYGDAMLII